MNKNRIIDIALITLLYIAVCTFPTSLITKNEIIYFAIEALLMAVMLVFLILYIRSHAQLIVKDRVVNFKLMPLFVPTTVVAISNLIYAWILKEPATPTFTWAGPLQVLFIALLVAIEEIIFRYLLIGHMEKGKPIVKILISAAIFGLCHLTHFFSTFNPADLIIVAYSFGLGLLLGFVYYYTQCPIACMCIHFLFNLCNDYIFTHLYSVSNTLWYFLINGIVAIVVGLYVLVLYLVKLRKNPAELG